MNWQLEEETASQSDSDCMIVGHTPASDEGTSEEQTEHFDPEAEFDPTSLPLFSEVYN